VIRLAKSGTLLAPSADRAEVVALAARLLAELGYPDCAASAAATVDLVMMHPAGISLVIEKHDHVVGFMGLVVGEHPVTGRVTGFEMGWYVDEAERRGTQGVRLLRRAEELARAKGAQELQLSVPVGRFAAFIERLGYTARETTFARELGD
jgi:GNAT superfamily N-acetyltransferase